MESKEEAKTQKLEKQNSTTHKDEVELIKNKWTKNIASPFLNHQKTWDDENHFKIPDDIRKNI